MKLLIHMTWHLQYHSFRAASMDPFFQAKELPEWHSFFKAEELPAWHSFFQSEELSAWHSFFKAEELLALHSFFKAEELPAWHSFFQAEELVPAWHSFFKAEELPAWHSFFQADESDLFAVKLGCRYSDCLRNRKSLHPVGTTKKHLFRLSIWWENCVAACIAGTLTRCLHSHVRIVPLKESKL
jgi:hypothetical protein